MSNAPVRSGRRGCWAALCALVLTPVLAVAQSAPPPPPAGMPPAVVTADVKPDDASPAQAIIPAQCSSCGGSYLGENRFPNTTGCADCVPGRTRECCNEDCDAKGPGMRLLCGIHAAICCPDPCYEPRWVALANAALF